MKKDPRNTKDQYLGWKERGMPFPDVLDSLAVVLREYIIDMEIGANTSPLSPRGSRSFARVNNLRSRVKKLALYFQKYLRITSWDDLVSSERDILLFFKLLREGEVTPIGDRPIKAVGSFVKVFKAFWHWYMRVQKKKGFVLPDVTRELDAQDAKPSFNYLSVEDVQDLADEANRYHKVLMWFLFDSGIRAPTELMNVRVSDLEWSAEDKLFYLTIRDEVSKTFGRKIKLMICSRILKRFIAFKSKDEYVFTKSPQRVNQYLKRLGHRILGIGVEGEKPGQLRKGLTMYDFRHSSACYWTLRYKSESALKYRFGWKKDEMILYYTDWLGMRDTISDVDMYVEVSKTELERQVAEEDRKIEELKEQLAVADEQLRQLQKIAEIVCMERMLENSTK